MKIEILERAPVRVFYRRYTGPFGEPLGKFWRNNITPWLADHGLLDCPRYGVSLDSPMNTPPEQCRYDACIEVPASLHVPDAEEMTIAGGPCAITHFKGRSIEIYAAWGAFVNECRSQSLDAQRPPFEHYPRGASFDAKTGVFACSLCLPVIS